MRNKRINWSNVVTWRAAAEPTGMVTHYRRINSNNNSSNNNSNSNNNNHAALAKLFQPSTLHKL